MTARTMMRLSNESKVRLHYGPDGQEVIGLVFDTGLPPNADELSALARELDRDGSAEEVRFRLLLGDTLSALEAVPGVSKRERVNALFRAFGERPPARTAPLTARALGGGVRNKRLGPAAADGIRENPRGDFV